MFDALISCGYQSTEFNVSFINSLRECAKTSDDIIDEQKTMNNDSRDSIVIQVVLNTVYGPVAGDIYKQMLDIKKFSLNLLAITSQRILEVDRELLIEIT